MPKTLQDLYSGTPFTLALSSGFFGFFAHLGFAQALEERGLRPRAYTGASAGAIIGAALASGWRAKDLEQLVLSVRFGEFFDPTPGLGFVRGRKMQNLLAKYMKPDFAQLAKPLRVSVFDIWSRRTRSLTEGELPRAVRASCSIPVMFHPVRFGRRFYWDGGILDKMAVTGIPESEPLLSHFLPSSTYERPSEQVKWGPLRRQIRLKNIPRCGPHKLHLGPEIIAYTRQETLKALAQSAD